MFWILLGPKSEIHDRMPFNIGLTLFKRPPKHVEESVCNITVVMGHRAT